MLNEELLLEYMVSFSQQIHLPFLSFYRHFPAAFFVLSGEGNYFLICCLRVSSAHHNRKKDSVSVRRLLSITSTCTEPKHVHTHVYTHKASAKTNRVLTAGFCVPFRSCFLKESKGAILDSRMSASQLLRILKTLPAGADDEICAFDTDEQEANMNKSSIYTNPFLSNEENNKGNIWTNPELECSTFGNDFTNNHEDEKFRKSLAAAYDVPTHLFGKATGFYIDKNAVECELPELMVCYKESDFHVKNICIDEGIPGDHKTILIDENNCEFLCNSVAVNEDDDMIEANLGTESSNNCADDVDQQSLQGSAKEFQKGAIVRSEAEELGQNGQTTDISNKSEMEGSVAFNFDMQKPAAGSNPSRSMNPESIHELSLETQSAIKHQDVANQMQYGQGEASFSMAGVISELITCSRPITFSGNISTRSDSSATSTRSFAFPTLQTEGNSSPVRMGKAERRRLRNYRGWRQGLLCCRF
ncbi:hypothetical protein L6452_18298 [Arctium lappa]|uniref:Uncharacterized protein n=1 Tax=Arctium lappa TaxID=4217 RepID=A0ACB9C5U1_ARCLA|nr:hypothetical protein L6452_18298 [Arctium lappa]